MRGAVDSRVESVSEIAVVSQSCGAAGHSASVVVAAIILTEGRTTSHERRQNRTT